MLAVMPANHAGDALESQTTMAESTDAGPNHEVREKVARMETIQRRLTEIVQTRHEMAGE